MTSDISQYSAIAIVMIFLIKEMFSYLRTRKNGTNLGVLSKIDEKLGNHLTEVNGRIDDLAREVRDMKMDMKIIKETINDIKIKMR